MKHRTDKRKYIILLGDGMADLPVESLGSLTPLEYAKTPGMDFIAKNGICGIAKTVPDGMFPGSDTANLSIFGYDPKKYYTGRAPLEALNMGIQMSDKDVAFRCNTVNIEDSRMKDFTADHIDNEFTRILINEISSSLNIKNIELYPGVSYRNLLIWRDYPYKELPETTPPHDIQDMATGEHIPKGQGSELLIQIMDTAKSIIGSSQRIREAFDQYKGNPNAIWFWGGGKKPEMDSFNDKYGLNGYTISAVDLIHGIGRGAGLKPLRVEGATGYLDTNYKGKVEALFKGLEEGDFIYLHVEAPDESGHEGNIEHKVKAIEDFDSKIVIPVLEGMKKYKDYTILVMPDHPTPVSIKTHSSDPVPFAIYRNTDWENTVSDRFNADSYSEIAAAKTGLHLEEGHNLINHMIKGFTGE